jgi:hypothetical protein
LHSALCLLQKVEDRPNSILQSIEFQLQGDGDGVSEFSSHAYFICDSRGICCGLFIIRTHFLFFNLARGKFSHQFLDVVFQSSDLRLRSGGRRRGPWFAARGARVGGAAIRVVTETLAGVAVNGGVDASIITGGTVKVAGCWRGGQGVAVGREAGTGVGRRESRGSVASGVEAKVGRRCRVARGMGRRSGRLWSARV